MLAVVTGASRGISRAYAHQLAARGYGLHLVGRNQQRLAAVAEELRTMYGAQLEETVMDLSRPDGAERLYMEVRSRCTHPVDLVVNNAGFGLYGEFTDNPMPQLQEMVFLHILTVSKVMRLFLPEMRERRSGAIINVASVAGLLPVPYTALYSATKAFMISLGLSVGREMQTYGIHIQTCCPGQTVTEFHATAGRGTPHAFGGQQTAEEVVAESLAALDRQRPLVITGARNRLLVRLQQFVPRQLVIWAASRSMKVYVGRR